MLTHWGNNQLFVHKFNLDQSLQKCQFGKKILNFHDQNLPKIQEFLILFSFFLSQNLRFLFTNFQIHISYRFAILYWLFFSAKIQISYLTSVLMSIFAVKNVKNSRIFNFVLAFLSQNLWFFPEFSNISNSFAILYWLFLARKFKLAIWQVLKKVEFSNKNSSTAPVCSMWSSCYCHHCQNVVLSQRIYDSDCCPPPRISYLFFFQV